MPSLNLNLDYFKNPRTLRLRAKLGPGAELLPLELWCHCARYQPESGRLSGYTLSEVESACGWSGRRGRAAEALLETGFLVLDTDGTFVVPDWLEEQGHIAAYRKRAKEAAQKRWHAVAGRGETQSAPIAETAREQEPSAAEQSNASSIAAAIAAAPACGHAPAIPAIPANNPAFDVVDKSMLSSSVKDKNMEPLTRDNKNMARKNPPDKNPDPPETENSVPEMHDKNRSPNAAPNEAGGGKLNAAPRGNSGETQLKLKLVQCYKSFQGIKSGCGWDAENLERNLRAAASLLAAFKGELRPA
ncbi:MAG TPA: hypothetical protein PLL10_04835, partial [Elusimicrobiales bacterium]|nr:hypothetical protein [Elusimicrobiales bacterium]